MKIAKQVARLATGNYVFDVGFDKESKMINGFVDKMKFHDGHVDIIFRCIEPKGIYYFHVKLHETDSVFVSVESESITYTDARFSS